MVGKRKRKMVCCQNFLGHENKVKTLIDAELKDNEELRARIFDIFVPTEKFLR